MKESATPLQPRIAIYHPTAGRLSELADRLCADDMVELRATGLDTDPLATLHESVRISREAYVACWDGEVQAVFGVADLPHDPTLGVPWLLSTGPSGVIARDFLQLAGRVLLAWLPMYRGLVNVASAQHTRARRLLKHLGFEVGTLHEFNGQAFNEFWRMQPSANQ